VAIFYGTIDDLNDAMLLTGADGKLQVPRITNYELLLRDTQRPDRKIDARRHKESLLDDQGCGRLVLSGNAQHPQQFRLQTRDHEQQSFALGRLWEDWHGRTSIDRQRYPRTNKARLSVRKLNGRGHLVPGSDSNSLRSAKSAGATLCGSLRARQNSLPISRWAFGGAPHQRRKRADRGGSAAPVGDLSADPHYR